MSEEGDRLLEFLTRREEGLPADLGTLDESLREELRACAEIERELSALSLSARGHPERAGPWVLLRPLGQGDAGLVYLGEREDAPGRAAVRLLVGPAAEQSVAVARQAMGWRHPGIAAVLDVGEGFFAAEPTSGVPLSRLLLALRRDPPANPRETALPLLRTLGPVAEAVGQAAGAGLTHGGICPGKLDLAKGGGLVLRDFGLFGSLAYLAPEQAAGEETGPASDARALAAVAWSIAIGAAPFAARTRSALLRRIREEEVRPVRSLAPWLPETVAGIVDAALARSPTARPPADALSSAFASL